MQTIQPTKRLAKQLDFDAVYDIYMDDSVVAYLGYDPMSKKEFTSIFDELLKGNDFFVYKVNNEIVGFVRVIRYSGRTSHIACIGTLAIKRSYQGQGLAAKLVQDLINELRTSSVKRVELIVESDNPKAIRFYQRLDFEIEGTLKKYYKRKGEEHYIDDHIMALLLD